MRFTRILLWMTILLMLSCEREISLYDIDGIASEIHNYQDELRVEAIMYPTENTALIRIDKTFSLDEDGLYDCQDNDGDWNPIIDDLGEDGKVNDPDDDDDDGNTNEPSIGENNGVPDCGEPHVDEYDEVLPQFHADSTVCSSVKLVGSQVEYPFTWSSEAAQLIAYPEYDPNLDDAVTEWYGAWIPESDIEFNLHEGMPLDDRIYTLECICGDYGTITAVDTLTLPVNFYEDSLGATPLYENIYNYPEILFLLQNCPVDNFWLTSSSGDPFSTRQVYFASSIEAKSYWVKVEEFSPTNIDLNTCSPTSLNYIHSFPAMSNEEGMLDDNTYITGTPVGEIPGYYRINVQTMSHGFENYYFFTSLDLHDPVRSNLRDENGEVVMGSFGGLTTNSLYTIVQLPPMLYFDHFDANNNLLYIGIDTMIPVADFSFYLTGVQLTGNVTGGEISNPGWNPFISVSSEVVSVNGTDNSIPTGSNILFAVFEIEPGSAPSGTEFCIDGINIEWQGHEIPYVVFYGPCMTVE